MLHVVVMAGGSGTRFWPQSRRSLPKQFLRLAGERTMLQATVDRCAGWVPHERISIVTGAAHVDITRELLPELPPDNVLGEPCARNTAPCVGLAAARLVARDPDAVMLLLPADHVIEPRAKFQEAVEAAQAIVARQPDRLVLFGVPPSFPATGYGYIERGDALPEGGFSVAAFREKPNRAKAEEFVRTGRFFWNCGIFVWRADRILAALHEFEPAMQPGLAQLRQATSERAWHQAVADVFPAFPSISIDYAVLERDPRIAMIEAPFSWDDVGSWQAVQRLLGADQQQNTVDGAHVGLDSSGCIVRSTDGHLIGTLGVHDLIIVHTPDATLVANKRDEESVKKLVEQMQKLGLDRYL